jgi:gentisate 1,2-dioxygenase
MSHETIKTAIEKCKEKEQIRKLTPGYNTKKEQPEKPKKKRKINWENVKKLIKGDKTPKHLKDAWKKALELHNKGLSDKEVKQKMGWKP